MTTTSDSATTNPGTCTGSNSSCSVTTLRSAIAVANSDYQSTGINKADTINLPAGTYTLSAYNGGQSKDIDNDVNYHFDLDGAASIIGAGQTSTIINGNNLDNVFDIDSGVVNTSLPSFDTYFANLTIENGRNSNNPLRQRK